MYGKLALSDYVASLESRPKQRYAEMQRQDQCRDLAPRTKSGSSRECVDGLIHMTSSEFDWSATNSAFRFVVQGLCKV